MKSLESKEMISILENGNNKVKCQKFTPDNLVRTMLDLLGYKTNLIGKKILENSFGTGKVLKAIVVRYIKSAIESGIDKTEISKGLSCDIYGIELDSDLYYACIKELNEILSDYSIPSVDWKLFNEDALTFDLGVTFDYVVGNPPYISYKEIDNSSRAVIKEKFNSCVTGKFDYCYAFIELGMRYLNNTGKLVQLIPNNIYKNVFGQRLRTLLADHISIIYDYPNQKLFDKALTSVSIFLYDKEYFFDIIRYENITDGEIKEINRKTLGDKWSFKYYSDCVSKKTRFGDNFNASVTIATLCNKAYLVDDKCISEEMLELKLLKEAVSPKTLRLNSKKKIIFPYEYKNDILQRYSKEVFEKLFPNIVKHLKQFSKELKNRNSDENISWFEYGRSQALAHLNIEKLLISTIITNKVEVYKLAADTIPFSGIYITVKNPEYSLDDAAEILKSKRFLKYVEGIGINISGNSVRVTCKDINNYEF